MYETLTRVLVEMQDLELGSALIVHLQFNGEEDAAAFLDDQIPPVPRGEYLAPGYQTPYEAPSDTFLAAILQKHNKVVGTVLCLFQILLVGVVAVTLFVGRDQYRERQLEDLRNVVSGKYRAIRAIEEEAICADGKFAVTVIQRLYKYREMSDHRPFHHKIKQEVIPGGRSQLSSPRNWKVYVQNKSIQSARRNAQEKLHTRCSMPAFSSLASSERPIHRRHRGNVANLRCLGAFSCNAGVEKDRRISGRGGCLSEKTHEKAIASRNTVLPFCVNGPSSLLRVHNFNTKFGKGKSPHESELIHVQQPVHPPNSL